MDKWLGRIPCKIKKKLVIQYITRVHEQLKKKMQISRGDWYYYNVFKL